MVLINLLRLSPEEQKRRSFALSMRTWRQKIKEENSMSYQRLLERDREKNRRERLDPEKRLAKKLYHKAWYKRKAEDPELHAQQLLMKMQWRGHVKEENPDLYQVQQQRKGECYRRWLENESPEKRCARLARGRDAHLRRNFGITANDFDDILRGQGGGCAICGKLQASGKHFFVDHDHKTEKVRGILCPGCNSAIGLMRDDPSRLASAITYLQRCRQNTDEGHKE